MTLGRLNIKARADHTRRKSRRAKVSNSFSKKLALRLSALLKNVPKPKPW